MKTCFCKVEWNFYVGGSSFPKILKNKPDLWQEGRVVIEPMFLIRWGD